MDKKKNNREIIDSYDYLGNAASTTDYTGLTPTPITSEAELESYDDIFPVYPYQIYYDNKEKDD